MVTVSESAGPSPPCRYWPPTSTSRIVHHEPFGIATSSADELLDQGDEQGCDVWNRIVKAINELERTKPGGGETLN
jgi:hypothetical protein